MLNGTNNVMFPTPVSLHGQSQTPLGQSQTPMAQSQTPMGQSQTPVTTIGRHTTVRTTVGNKKMPVQNINMHGQNINMHGQNINMPGQNINMPPPSLRFPQPNQVPPQQHRPRSHNQGHEHHRNHHRRQRRRGRGSRSSSTSTNDAAKRDAKHETKNYDQEESYHAGESRRLPKNYPSHDGQYDFVRTDQMLGEGAFSKCYLVKDNKSNLVAAGKFFTRDASSSQKKLERFEREVNLMRMLNHPNIVHFYADISGVFDNRKLNTFQEREHVSFKHPPLMVMEFCSGGSVSSQMKQRRPHKLHEDQKYGILSDKETLWVAECCARALIYIKQFRIIHRDVKMGNLLLQNPPTEKNNITTSGIVLCDFGLATQLKQGQARAKGTAGTPNYMAPEVVSRQGACFASDMWSLGITMFHCLTGRCPFPASEVEETYDRIERNDYRWRSHEKKSVTKEMRQLVDTILVTDTERRLTPEQLLQAIESIRNTVNLK
jgi:hypothetical protein